MKIPLRLRSEAYLHPCLLLLIAHLLIFGTATQAQDVAEPARNVAFIEGRPLNTASVTDIGADGLSRLRQLFMSMGATTRRLALDGPIPPDVEIVVIVRPMQPLSVRQTAYLWDFLARGGHLLLALDPNGHNRVSTEVGRTSGLSRLLAREYGINILDDFLIEPWASAESLSTVLTSWSVAQAEAFVPHPIIAPLVEYDLPLRFWGGRSMTVDSLTGIAATNALIATESGYGETSRINFNSDDPNQLVLNIGADTQGRLLLGAVGENSATGSRVAVLGDSELLQNLYGQLRMLGRETQPRHVGNHIFTDRLIAWLMGIPEEDWPPLPAGYTWIALDGDLSDWAEGIAESTDLALDSDITSDDLQRVRMQHNDGFLYIAVETRNPMREDIRLQLNFGEGEARRSVLLEDGAASILLDPASDAAIPIEDANYAIKTSLEARLPLRVVGLNPVLTQICVLAEATVLTDCMEMSLTSTPINTIDPAPLRFGSTPLAYVREGANLRSGPGTNFGLITYMPAQTFLAVTGRNEEGDWLQVRNGSYEGWMAGFLVVVNADVGELAVRE